MAKKSGQRRQYKPPQGFTREGGWIRGEVITFQGKSQGLQAWAKEIDIKISTLWKRIYVYGYSVERALTTPLLRNQRGETE